MARPFIPKSIEDCSIEWLTSALRETGLLGDEAAVSNVRAQLLGEGGGFMGAVARLELEYSGDAPDAPRSVVAKVPSRHRKTRAEGEMLGLYEREILFYREFGDTLRDSIPRCYHSAMDPNPRTPEDNEQLMEFVDKAPWWLLRILRPIGNWLARLSRRRYVLLLEDLAEGRMGDQVEGGRTGDLPAMVSALATLHARFWNSEEITRVHWIPRIDAGARPIHLMFRKAIPRFAKHFHGLEIEKIQQLQTWLSEHWLELLSLYRQAPLTLLHGDYRLDNIVFMNGNDEEGADLQSSVVAFDWQLPVQGPGAYDLAYLLISTIAHDAPRGEVSDMLSLYHDGLMHWGVEDYSMRELERDYRRSLLMHVHRLTPSLTGIKVTNERGHELQRCWVRRLDARVEGLEPDALLTDDPLASH
jgi:thiamine kinase-like enzyme